MKNKIEIRLGIPESLRLEAAQLYDAAFGAKFSLAIPSKEKRIKMLEESMVLDFGFAAIEDQQLVGLAGIHTNDGSLTAGITYQSLCKTLGALGGNRAAIVFGFYERKLQSGEMLMDGIAVRADKRGCGIGTMLLKAVVEHATLHQFDSVRLGVIDTNSGARRLYERHEFRETKTEEFGYLRWVLGFGSSTTMVRDLKSAKPSQ